jgi:hypothetical protein
MATHRTKYARSLIDSAVLEDVRVTGIPAATVNCWFDPQVDVLYVCKSNGTVIPIGGSGSGVITLLVGSFDVSTLVPENEYPLPLPLPLGDDGIRIIDMSFTVADLVGDGTDARVKMALVGYDDGAWLGYNSIGNFVSLLSLIGPVTFTGAFSFPLTGYYVLDDVTSALPAPNKLTDLSFQWDVGNEGSLLLGTINLYVTYCPNQNAS